MKSIVFFLLILGNVAIGQWTTQAPSFSVADLPDEAFYAEKFVLNITGPVLTKLPGELLHFQIQTSASGVVWQSVANSSLSQIGWRYFSDVDWVGFAETGYDRSVFADESGRGSVLYISEDFIDARFVRFRATDGTNTTAWRSAYGRGTMFANPSGSALGSHRTVIASDEILGHVRIGSGLVIDTNGVVSTGAAFPDWSDVGEKPFTNLVDLTTENLIGIEWLDYPRLATENEFEGTNIFWDTSVMFVSGFTNEVLNGVYQYAGMQEIFGQVAPLYEKDTDRQLFWFVEAWRLMDDQTGEVEISEITTLDQASYPHLADWGLLGTIETSKTSIGFGGVKSSSGVKVGNHYNDASSSNVGTMRYRAIETNSFFEVVMQTGSNTYEWVEIVRQEWSAP